MPKSSDIQSGIQTENNVRGSDNVIHNTNIAFRIHYVQAGVVAVLATCLPIVVKWVFSLLPWGSV